MHNYLAGISMLELDMVANYMSLCVVNAHLPTLPLSLCLGWT